MIDREAGMPEDRRIRFRIGINLGDIIVEDDDIFGDGVNVAARLEALAEPGGICVSGTVRDHIRDKLPYPLKGMGEHDEQESLLDLYKRAIGMLPDGALNAEAAE
jgi:adenylate cyclase